MKMVYVKSPFQFEMRELPKPGLKFDTAVVRVMACGICGSDLMTAESQAKEFQLFGHEIAGVVEKINNENMGIKHGDNVIIESTSYCGKCVNCRNGRLELCQDIQSFGKFGYGGFGEYILSPVQSLVKFDVIDFDIASLAEPLGVALDMVYLAGIRMGDSVLVVGPGPIGLMAVRLAKLKGANRVYLSGKSNSKNIARLAVGKKMGADEIIYADKTSLKEAIPEGVDKVLLTAAPSLLPGIIKVMKFGGIISYVGIDYGSAGTFNLDANEFHFKRLQLRASFAVPALFIPQALTLLKERTIDGKILISHRFPLKEISRAMEVAKDEKEKAIKVVILPDRI